MSNYSREVPIPARSTLNNGINSCGSSLANIFGRPGRLTVNCSPITNELLLPLIVTRDVGPFRVTGLRPAVESLERIFDRVHSQKPQLFKEIKTAGMTCCRLIRGSSRSYSIHSWGGAIDLYTGDDIVPLGAPRTDLGVLECYSYFHSEGWYWGAAFKRNDAMHYEVSAQWVARQKAAKWHAQYQQVAQSIMDADKLVLNGFLLKNALLKEGHWWAPAKDVAKALDNELPADSVQMVKVREAIVALGYKIVRTNDQRVKTDRFYIAAYPSRGL